jgi:hypothetical protein
MSALNLANQQTQASTILSETDPYENDRFDPDSPGTKEEEPESEESSAGSSFSMDRATPWYPPQWEMSARSSTVSSSGLHPFLVSVHWPRSTLGYNLVIQPQPNAQRAQDQLKDLNRTLTM